MWVVYFAITKRKKKVQTLKSRPSMWGIGFKHVLIRYNHLRSWIELTVQSQPWYVQITALERYKVAVVQIQNPTRLRLNTIDNMVINISNVVTQPNS